MFDVAIVGCGPAGVVAAALLGQAGLRVQVCDRLRGVYEIPRAIALDHEIMRVFQQVGVVEAIAPHLEPFTPSEYFGVDSQLIRRMTMVEPPWPQGYTPSLVFSQPPVERALRERVARMPNVTLALGTEVTGLKQDAEGAELALHSDDGSTSALRARWVIGCDGGASTVRGLVGIELEDLDFDEPWLVVDVIVNDRGLARLPKTSVQYCEPERPCTLVIGPGRHRRWEISLQDGEDPKEAATPEGTWRLLSRWLGPEDGTLWRQASYRFHALVASRWRAGRVFVAGDAAHMQPPFLGQGMCQGVRDVANLAWKLASVLKGEVRGTAAEALLDSYGVERKAHVRELTSRIKAIGAVICERDVAKARARDARLLAECGGVVKDTPRQDVLPRLETGLLSARETSGRGTLFPQPRLADGALMDERFGTGWRLVLDESMAASRFAALSDGPPAPLPASPPNALSGVISTSLPAAPSAPLDAALAASFAAPRGVPEPAASRVAPALTMVPLGAGTLREAEGVVAGWMQRHHAHAALVRPDHYTYGVAADGAELDALLAEWRAALAG